MLRLVDAGLPLATADATNADGIDRAARKGIAGSARALPHAERIQESFGRHDVGSIRAHVGGHAIEATQRLGATAYATGSSVAFRAAPDLHTAAHEAAHVVQQRHGVHLAGNIGQEGDRYERHADAVADAVVAGRSAQELLDTPVGGDGRRNSQPSTLQRQSEAIPEDEERLPEGEAAAEPIQGRFVQRRTYKGRGGIGIMAPADMPYFTEMGTATTYDVEASVSWEPRGIPKISVESRDLKIETNGPGDIVSLTPVYMDSQFYGRPYPSKQK